MTYDTDLGRDDLRRFDAAQPDNYWRADTHFQRVLRYRAGEARLSTWEPVLDSFGAECAGPIDAAVRVNNETSNLPSLERFDGFGDRLEAVAHHPSFHLAGRAIYGSGVMQALGEADGNLKSLALFYLSSHNGEAGHNCPLACTAGAIKALRALGTPELKERFLPRLLATDYTRLAHGGQFLTEVQGGSDVGANSVEAVADGTAPGGWRLRGEKWFCSNVTADVIIVTARVKPAATGNGVAWACSSCLGACRMAPTPSPFAGSRTRSARARCRPPSRLNGAAAWPLGPLDGGFKNVMTYVINTSRVFNAVGRAGLARRACLVAHGYAQHRQAFGNPIGAYPMLQEALVDMRAETAAMVSGTFLLVATADRIERGDASKEEVAFWRLAVNLNKTRSALSSHEVVQSGLEVLGGNGTIESFSVVPRLLRDNVVFENWEGSHNVLLLQVLRDCRTKKLHEAFFARLSALAAAHPRLMVAVHATREAFGQAIAGDDALATLALRPLGGRMAFLLWAAAMHEDGTDSALIDHFVDRRLDPPATRDASYVARLAALSREA